MAFSSISFMDALRVAAKTKDAPPDWLLSRQWPAELTDPAFSPTVKKRRPCPFDPPHLKSLSSPDGAATPVVSSPSCSVSSTKLLVLPNGPFRFNSPAREARESSREVTSPVGTHSPLVRAMTAPAPSRASRADVSPLRLDDLPLSRSASRGATRSTLSRVFANRSSELSSSSSEPNLIPDADFQKVPDLPTSFDDHHHSSTTKRGYSACSDVTGASLSNSSPDWVRSAIASSLRGETAGRSPAELIEPGKALVPELGKAVRLLRKKLSQERERQPHKPPVPPPTTTQEHQNKIRQSPEFLPRVSQNSPGEDPSASASTDTNRNRRLSLPEVLHWEAGVVAMGGQQYEGPSAMNVEIAARKSGDLKVFPQSQAKSLQKFSFHADGSGKASSGGARSSPAIGGGFGGEVRDEEKVCIHELLGQISGNNNEDGAVGGTSKGDMAQHMDCDGQVGNCVVPGPSFPPPNFSTPEPAFTPEGTATNVSAPPRLPRKRPPPPPPLVDVANVACAAFEEMCSSADELPSGTPEAAAGIAAGVPVTPPAGASAASVAAAAELPCPTPTGWGTGQWERFFPPEPPTPSGMGPLATLGAGTTAEGGETAGITGVVTDGNSGAGNNGGFASMWSEAWTEGFNVDLSGLAGNPALW